MFFSFKLVASQMQKANAQKIQRTSSYFFSNWEGRGGEKGREGGRYTYTARRRAGVEEEETPVVEEEDGGPCSRGRLCSRGRVELREEGGVPNNKGAQTIAIT